MHVGYKEKVVESPVLTVNGFLLGATSLAFIIPAPEGGTSLVVYRVGNLLQVLSFSCFMISTVSSLFGHFLSVAHLRKSHETRQKWGIVLFKETAQLFCLFGLLLLIASLCCIVQVSIAPVQDDNGISIASVVILSLVGVGVAVASMLLCLCICCMFDWQGS